MNVPMVMNGKLRAQAIGSVFRRGISVRDSVQNGEFSHL
jgi:hypothetical protein